MGPCRPAQARPMGAGNARAGAADLALRQARLVDHTVMDTTAIDKLIETRFGLEPLGSRDAASPDMTEAFDLQ